MNQIQRHTNSKISSSVESMHQQGAGKKQRYSSRTYRMGANVGPANNGNFNQFRDAPKQSSGRSSQNDMKLNGSGQLGGTAVRPQSRALKLSEL